MAKSRRYKQKNLGYPRATTSDRLRVTMPDGSLYDIPVQLIADSRDEYYSIQDPDAHEDTVKLCRDSDDNYEILDWAGGNMNWEDVEPYSKLAGRTPIENDFQEGWINGDKEIVSDDQ